MAIIVWGSFSSGLRLMVAKSTLIFLDYIGLEGQMSAYLGSRSYSIYLSHSAVAAIACDFGLAIFPWLQRRRLSLG